MNTLNPCPLDDAFNLPISGRVAPEIAAFEESNAKKAALLNAKEDAKHAIEQAEADAAQSIKQAKADAERTIRRAEAEGEEAIKQAKKKLEEIDAALLDAKNEVNDAIDVAINAARCWLNERRMLMNGLRCGGVFLL